MVKKGDKMTKEHKMKISLAVRGSNNGNWRGGTSDWYYEKRVQKLNCQMCGVSRKEKLLDVNHVDGNHKNNNPSNWEVLCRKCHMIKDGRIKNLIKSNKTEKRRQISSQRMREYNLKYNSLRNRNERYCSNLKRGDKI